MSDHDPLDPIDPALGSLFREEHPPEAPRGVRERVFARVAASIAVPAPIGGPPGGGVEAARAGLRLQALAAWVAGAFVIGAGVGAGAVLVWRAPSPPRVVYVERTRPAPTALAPDEPHDPTPAPSALPATTPPGDAGAPRAESSARLAPRNDASDALSAERRVLDSARERLTQGDGAVALKHLDEHARRFPHATLAEEREALAIQALANLGRYDDARRRADMFHARWQNSVYAAAVKATIASIP
jgi:hypothetical protein